MQARASKMRCRSILYQSNQELEVNNLLAADHFLLATAGEKDDGEQRENDSRTTARGSADDGTGARGARFDGGWRRLNRNESEPIQTESILKWTYRSACCGCRLRCCRSS